MTTKLFERGITYIPFVFLLLMNCNNNDNKKQNINKANHGSFYPQQSSNQYEYDPKIDTNLVLAINYKTKRILDSLNILEKNDSLNEIVVSANDDECYSTHSFIFSNDFNLVLRHIREGCSGEWNDIKIIYEKDLTLNDDVRLYYCKEEYGAGYLYEKTRIYYRRGNPICGIVNKTYWESDSSIMIATDSTTSIIDTRYNDLDEMSTIPFYLNDLDSCLQNLNVTKKIGNRYYIYDSSIIKLSTDYNYIGLDSNFYKRYLSKLNENKE